MTPNLEQAARQAIHKINQATALDEESDELLMEALTALREALAEQAEQEPTEKSYYIEGVEHGFAKGVERCAKLIESGEFGIGHMMSMHDDESVAQALRELNTSPVRTKDLTDDELQPFLDEWWNLPCDTAYDVKKIFRAVIAADREKNRG